MVMDSLHIICGNCGHILTQNEDYEWSKAEIVYDEFDGYNVFIYCENCATVHSLVKYMKVEGE